MCRLGASHGLAGKWPPPVGCEIVVNVDLNLRRNGDVGKMYCRVVPGRACTLLLCVCDRCVCVFYDDDLEYQ